MCNHIFLFSVDLEDVRLSVPGGEKYAARVPQMVDLYLAFLRKHNACCTFFIVGNQLEKYPDLIKKMAAQGHEIAFHTYSHTPLAELGPKGFEKEIIQFLDAAGALGITAIEGFRAPIFSLTEDTSWAYPILKKYGFTYSSSVLPAPNPLFGWKDFGHETKNIGGIIEMPMTLHNIFPIPLAGGVYFRVIPFFLLKRSIKKVFASYKPLQSYFHPYDIDHNQERFMHPGINNSKIFNYLMYFNRKNLFIKLEKIMALNATIMPYNTYIRKYGKEQQ
jgi:polysaccharide deacetylase family protein (PEP-CTERM system associated)